mgnify:CR=1 FL=1
MWQSNTINFLLWLVDHQQLLYIPTYLFQIYFAYRPKNKTTGSNVSVQFNPNIWIMTVLTSLKYNNPLWNKHSTININQTTKVRLVGPGTMYSNPPV